MRRTLLLPALALTGLACGGPSETRIKAADYTRMEEADAAARAQQQNVPRRPGAPDSNADAVAAATAAANRPVGEARLSPEHAKQRNELDDRTLKLTRRREDQARALAELDAKRSKISIEQASATASELMAVTQAEREHAIAAEDLDHFVNVEKARRIAEDALELARAQDGLLETREELAQLEMMYSDSSLGDATAEIVLNRTRRRLERAESGFALRSQHSTELNQITLPREQHKLELELQAKTVALENSQRARDAGRLARDAVLRELEADARKQQREAEDIDVEARRLQQDLDRFSRDIAADHADNAPTPGSPATP